MTKPSIDANTTASLRAKPNNGNALARPATSADDAI